MTKAQLESFARSWTKVGIQRLGGLASAPQTPDNIAIEAIKILLDRGYGRPKQQTELSGLDGSDINITIRNVIEEMRANNKQTETK